MRFCVTHQIYRKTFASLTPKASRFDNFTRIQMRNNQLKQIVNEFFKKQADLARTKNDKFCSKYHNKKRKSIRRYFFLKRTRLLISIENSLSSKNLKESSLANRTKSIKSLNRIQVEVDYKNEMN